MPNRFYSSLESWFPAHERFNIVFNPYIPICSLVPPPTRELSEKWNTWRCPGCEAEEYASEVSRWENEGGK